MNTTQSDLGITRRQALKMGTGAITTVVTGVAIRNSRHTGLGGRIKDKFQVLAVA